MCIFLTAFVVHEAFWKFSVEIVLKVDEFFDVFIEGGALHIFLVINLISSSFFFINLFIYLSIYGCVGSSFLCKGFL